MFLSPPNTFFFCRLKITEERDDLLSKLDNNEGDLEKWKASLEEVIAERKQLEEERDTLQAEKTKLETQLSGLSHRINDFEVQFQLLFGHLS